MTKLSGIRCALEKWDGTDQDVKKRGATGGKVFGTGQDTKGKEPVRRAHSVGTVEARMDQDT